jgi:hypothetical protein
VSDKDIGLFPPEFQAKYQAYKDKLDKHSLATSLKVNKAVPGGDGGSDSPALGDIPDVLKFYKKHGEDTKVLDKEFEILKAEAVKMGIIPPK